MAMAKTKLRIDAFRATQSMLLPIPSPTIVPIVEGSPPRKPEDIPEEPCLHLLQNYLLTKTCNTSYLSSTNNKTRGKSPSRNSPALKPP